MFRENLPKKDIFSLLYLFSLPFLASATILRRGGKLDFVEGGIGGYIPAIVALLSASYSILFLVRNKTYRKILVQNMKTNLVFVLLLLSMVVSYTANILLKTGPAGNFEISLRFIYHLLMAFVCVLVLPLLVARTKLHFDTFTISVVIIGFIPALIALLGSMGIHGFSEMIIKNDMILLCRYSIPATQSIINEPNIFGTMCFISFCFAAYLSTQTDRLFWRVPLFFVLAVDLSGIFLSYSRTCWGLTLIFTFLFYVFRDIRNVRKISACSIIVTVVLFTMFGVGYWLVNTIPNCQFAGAESFIERLMLWKIGASYATKHIYSGIGISPHDMMDVLRTGPEAYPRISRSAHNIFIDTLLVYGTFATLLTALFFVQCFYRILRPIIVIQHNFHYMRIRQAFMVASLISFFILLQMFPYKFGDPDLSSMLLCIFFGLGSLRNEAIFPINRASNDDLQTIRRPNSSAGR